MLIKLISRKQFFGLMNNYVSCRVIFNQIGSADYSHQFSKCVSLTTEVGLFCTAL